MSASFFQRVVVPVANKDDAEATTEALAPYVDEAAGTVIAVHVIEKAGGAPDKASVEQREVLAEEIFDVVADGLADTGANLETEHLYGTDIAQTILDASQDLDADAIVFTPRDGSRWLLTGDVTTTLVNKADIPVVVLPDRTTGDVTNELD